MRFRGEAGRKVCHTQNITYAPNMHTDTCFINLSMLEAVTVGCWDATLAMTISCTSGLMIESVGQTAGTALPVFNVLNLEGP